MAWGTRGDRHRRALGAQAKGRSAAAARALNSCCCDPSPCSVVAAAPPALPHRPHPDLLRHGSGQVDGGGQPQLAVKDHSTAFHSARRRRRRCDTPRLAAARPACLAGACPPARHLPAHAVIPTAPLFFSLVAAFPCSLNFVSFLLLLQFDARPEIPGTRAATCHSRCERRDGRFAARGGPRLAPGIN